MRTKGNKTKGEKIDFPEAHQVRECIDYNPLTGSFKWAKKGQGIRLGKEAGTFSKDGRREICILGRRHKAARLAWLMSTGEWPKFCIDHINGDPSDDRIENLRDVPHKTNIQNQRKAHTGNHTSGLLGVTKHYSGKWHARICKGKKSIHLGAFTDPMEAHQAYLQAKRDLHPGCTI